MSFLAWIAIVLGPVSTAPQEAAPPPRAAIEIVRPVDPEFDALERKYAAAIRSYDDLRIRRVQGKTDAPEPAHPALRFLKDFQALAARGGGGGALGWILANLQFVAGEPGERLRLAQETFPQILAGHADEEAALRALEGLRASLEDLGDGVVFEMAEALAEKTAVEEIRGQAKLLQAWARTLADSTHDPERLEDAAEIHREILYTMPKTRAAKQVSGILYGPLHERFFALERRWVDELLALQGRGEPPEAWPRQPIHGLVGEFQILADAGHYSAKQFVTHLYPEYEMVERQGPGLAYSWLANKLGEAYSDGLDGRWTCLRSDLQVVLYRQFPAEPWVFDSLQRLAGHAAQLPFDRVERAMQAILEKNEDPRARAAALFCMAQSVRSRGDQRSYERAIELYTRARDEHPEGRFRQAAESSRAELAAVMPGQPAPRTRLTDVQGLPLDPADYKGRVVVLEFWSFEWPGFLEGISARAELDSKYRLRPLTLLGINTDNRTVAQFQELAAKHGVYWRCATTHSGHPILAGWAVRCQPTTVLIDKDGIIRARDLPWSEMTELAEKLVLEAEAPAAGDAREPR
ncbi:MAG: TlpA disulfide reductase family protein [Planctomycetota bacterium]